MEQLEKPLRVGAKTLPNRVVFQPMEGCDCNADGSPSDLTVRKYRKFAASGAAIVWMEATAVVPEGKANPRQMYLTRENLDAFRAFLFDLRETAMRETGRVPLFFLQQTHSGRQSVAPMIAYRNPVYEKTRPVGDGAIVTDDYLDTLPDAYAASARLAYEAGFDGVDVKSCHGYLVQELLSAFDRPGRYGGTFENRTRLFLDCFRAVRAAVPDDCFVVSRLDPADMVPKPWGFGTDEENRLDLGEGLRLIKELYASGLRLADVTLGNPYYNPHVNRPFRRGAYTPPESPDAGLSRFVTVERAIKEAFPDLLLVGSGFSYYRGEMFARANEQIAAGVCDLAGFGRVTLAYPEFWRDHLAGTFDERKACVTCSKCTELMRAHQVSGCAVFDEVYRDLYRETVQKQQRGGDNK